MKSFNAKFTNLGATGRLGPASLGSHYVGKNHENMVTVQNGAQYLTVPYTGTYEITAVGAAGGYDTYGASARGRSAYMRGEFQSNRGAVLKILAGQEGVKNTKSYHLEEVVDHLWLHHRTFRSLFLAGVVGLSISAQG
jgi:tripartite motif-containing protein 56